MQRTRIGGGVTWCVWRDVRRRRAGGRTRASVVGVAGGAGDDDALPSGRTSLTERSLACTVDTGSSMTLLVCVGNQDYCYLASDRRLTAGEHVAYENSSKSVAFFCDDARCALAFTGLALLDGDATAPAFDTQYWLVDTLSLFGKTSSQLTDALLNLQHAANRDLPAVLARVPPKQRTDGGSARSAGGGECGGPASGSWVLDEACDTQVTRLFAQACEGADFVVETSSAAGTLSIGLSSYEWSGSSYVRLRGRLPLRCADALGGCDAVGPLLSRSGGGMGECVRSDETCACVFELADIYDEGGSVEFDAGRLTMSPRDGGQRSFAYCVESNWLYLRASGPNESIGFALARARP